MRKLLIFVTLIAFLNACKTDHTTAPTYTPTKYISVDSAAVVTAHPIASKIGLQILRDGGNAVDAAIAVQFALAVCFPVAGNLGGGGFMVYRDKNGAATTLDFREMAPGSSTMDMYLDKDGNVNNELVRNGALSAGVPGTVAGMHEAFVKYSRLKNWEKLVQPAIDIATNGFKITERQASMYNDTRSSFVKYNRYSPPIIKSTPWKSGDLFIQEDLAFTLTRIRDLQRDGFYKGDVANLIVEEMNATNGQISLDDLSSYEAKWRDPITCDFDGYTIYSMPPPSSGGIALCQLFEMVEPYNLEQYGMHSTRAMHIMIEAERRVFADRATHLGDSDFYDVPSTTLLDPSYLKNRMSTVGLAKAGKSKNVKAGQIKESTETTHFSIVDAEGNAVSITTTINGAFGSKQFVKGAGFLLNNEMDDFSAKPGSPNLYGLLGAEANKIEPKKRMLSSMTPTIISKNGKLKMILGTPGGSTIITSVFQTALNIIEFKKDIKTASDAPRFHHQWLPDSIMIEKNLFSSIALKKLEDMGHNFKEVSAIGKVETIWINDDGKIEAVADRRADDHAAGY